MIKKSRAIFPEYSPRCYINVLISKKVKTHGRHKSTFRASVSPTMMAPYDTFLPLSNVSRNSPPSFPGGFRDPFLVTLAPGCPRRCVDTRKPKVQVGLGWYTLSCNVITNGCRNEYKHFRLSSLGIPRHCLRRCRCGSTPL